MVDKPKNMQNPKVKSQKEAKLKLLTHKYVTAHFPGLVQCQG